MGVAGRDSSKTEQRPDRLLPWLVLHRASLPRDALEPLLARFGTPAAIIAASRKELLPFLSEHPRVLERIRRGVDESAFEPERSWLEQESNYLITWQDERYPRLLRECVDAPLALFVRGDPATLGMPQLAIVGSRNPTPGGAETARAFSAALAEAGLVITSGLALGVDAAAHRGCLQAGGATIAVAGTGLDRVYPARHRELAHEIAARGALVSELPLGSPPKREHFPLRNRLISGMSVGTLVVEAAVQSGSLITARLAGEQGREVFAIPGSIHSPLSRGCHALIRQGAKLVETARDIIEELGPLLAVSMPKAAGRRDDATLIQKDEQTDLLLKFMGYDPVDVNTLADRSGLTADMISSMLLRMELRGLVAAGPGGKYQRTAQKVDR